jgi:hypothetical protein
LFGNTIRFTEPVGESSYHGGFVRLQRRYAEGYSYLATYTFSKSIDNASVIDDQARDVHDRSLDRGRSSFDIRHRAVLSGTWDLPIGIGHPILSSGPAAYILGNWQVSGTFSLRSGFPFTVLANGDACNCGAAGQTARQIDGVLGNARAQVRAEVFNLFNRDNYGQPGNTVGTPTFGVIQTASDPRTAQIALKLVF